MQARVGLGQFLGALLDLLLENLLIVFLILDIDAGTDPTNDFPLRVADRIALYQKPAIASVGAADAIFDLNRLSTPDGMFPL